MTEQADQTTHQKLMARWPNLGELSLAVSNAKGEFVNKTTVQGWQQTGTIPAKYHSYVLFAGQALDPKVVHADFFGEVPNAKR